MSDEIRMIETPNGIVEYTVKGSGSPMLVLHGSLENCGSCMFSEALLHAGFTVITPSRPGYGNTPAESGRTAEAAADLFAALLDRLEIRQAGVVANSYGGPTGLYLAAKHPDKVHRLVLASAVTKPIDDVKRIEEMKKFYGKGHEAMWGMLGFIGLVSPKGLAKKTFELFSTCDTRAIMKEIERKDVDAVVRFYRKKPENKGALLDAEHAVAEDVLKGIAAPTLIVHSREDRAVSFSHAEHANRLIAGSELFVAETWGHFVTIGRGSGEVLDRIVNFLKG